MYELMKNCLPIHFRTIYHRTIRAVRNFDSNTVKILGPYFFSTTSLGLDITLKAGNKANASHSYRNSFAVRKPSPSLRLTPKLMVITAIAAINLGRTIISISGLKQEFHLAQALPLFPITDKRAKIPNLSTFPKPVNDDQLINSVSKTVTRI